MYADPLEFLYGICFVFFADWISRFVGDWIWTVLCVALIIFFVICFGSLVWKCCLLLPTICQRIIVLFNILIYSLIYSLALMMITAANAAEVTKEEIFIQSAITGSKILLMEEKFYNLSWIRVPHNSINIGRKKI